jgi:hypothetical protein
VKKCLKYRQPRFIEVVNKDGKNIATKKLHISNLVTCPLYLG